MHRATVGLAAGTVFLHRSACHEDTPVDPDTRHSPSRDSGTERLGFDGEGSCSFGNREVFGVGIVGLIVHIVMVP